MKNLLAELPTQLPAELVTVLAQNRHVRIERIVSTGHKSPDGFWYDQDEHEWIMVLQGEAKLQFDTGEVVDMVPGDHILLPAHKRHRVQSTSPDQPTVWLAVYYRS